MVIARATTPFFILNKNPTFHYQLTVKQAASIFILSLLAFNWVGYRLVSSFIEHRSDLALETKIDNSQYEESSLLELRVPLNAPYLTETSSEYERYDGEIEIDGIHYKYVKRKIVNGDLVLLCLPNEDKTKIHNSRTDFFKLINDLNQSSQNKKNNTTAFKSFITEFRQENNSWAMISLSTVQLKHAVPDNLYLATGFITIPEHPPCA